MTSIYTFTTADAIRAGDQIVVKADGRVVLRRRGLIERACARVYWWLGA